MFSPLYRVVRGRKERRRLWAQRKTPRQSARVENGQEDAETETDENSQTKKGMLPTNIVEMLASREKYDISIYPSIYLYIYISLFVCVVLVFTYK